jgi:ribosomal protein S18 acetylase RimI-like enzyme
MSWTMITVKVPDKILEIRPVTEDDLHAVLEVYQNCEDFLALGPIATASMEMVLKDIELSKEEGGIFCGIFDTADGKMIGVVDYVPNNFQSNPQAAYLELLMIDSSFRSRGIGKAVFNAVENEIRKNPSVTLFFAGVQVNNPRAVKFWQQNGFRITSEAKLMPDQTVAFDLQKDFSSGFSP